MAARVKLLWLVLIKPDRLLQFLFEMYCSLYNTHRCGKPLGQSAEDWKVDRAR